MRISDWSSDVCSSDLYGSGAVAGVVNIKTKTDIDGLELNFNTSVPFDSGGEEYRASAVWGKTFSRGHILLAADYSKVKELNRGDRSYLACPEAYNFREDGSRADRSDPRTGKPKRTEEHTSELQSHMRTA